MANDLGGIRGHHLCQHYQYRAGNPQYDRTDLRPSVRTNYLKVQFVFIYLPRAHTHTRHVEVSTDDGGGTARERMMCFALFVEMILGWTPGQ